MNLNFDNIKNKHIPLIEAAVSYYSSLLMSSRLYKNISIDIIGHEGLIDGYANGMCTWEDTYVKPRDFSIEINTEQDDVSFYTALAHEMVHVKQFAREEIKERFKPNYTKLWYGKIVDTKKVNYWDLPWEIEANGRQEGMVIRFCDYIKKELNLDIG